MYTKPTVWTPWAIALHEVAALLPTWSQPSNTLMLVVVVVVVVVVVGGGGGDCVLCANTHPAPCK